MMGTATRRALTAAAVLLAVTPARAAEPPLHTLQGNGLKLTVALPDAKDGYYRGTRFDWSGLVTKAETGGYTVFSNWLGSPADPTYPSTGSGTFEEFGIESPLGYAEAPAGGTFVKIGIGVLEKPAEAKYNFGNAYKIVRPGEWQVTTGDRSIEFRQELAHPAGYAYRYTKRVALADAGAGFTIDHTLANTGTKRIDTDHYCHNFLTVDGDPVGPNYALRFGFPATAKTPKELFGIAEVRGDRLVFVKPLMDKEYVQSQILGWDDAAATNRVTVEHAPSGLALHIQGDRPLSKLNVWSVKTTLCPEPFVRVALDPGQSMSWATRYEFGRVMK
jgi:hypothetical protein